jgi:hypothetical protein
LTWIISGQLRGSICVVTHVTENLLAGLRINVLKHVQTCQIEFQDYRIDEDRDMQLLEYQSAGSSCKQILQISVQLTAD